MSCVILAARTASDRFQIWLCTSRVGLFLARWGGPILITALAAVMRLIHLGYPHKLIFDETYYVKEGYSMFVSGYERHWLDDNNTGTTNQAFEAGNPETVLEAGPEYVVHPPVGKWMIGIGIRLFGVDSSFGWRFSSAMVGIISVFLVILIGRRLFESQTLGCIAGLLLSVDGQHIVHSRTGLLDPFLMFWALVAFYLVLLDRAQMRKRLDAAMDRIDGYSSTGRPLHTDKQWGPRLGMRWYLLLAGISLGLATGVKWSGLYFAAAFGALVVAWDCADRKAAGIRRWWEAGLTLDGVKAFVLMIPVMAVTYLGTWIGWFLSKDAYYRGWADNPDNYSGSLPPALASWLHYHKEAWNFHTSLTTEHNYEENALSWLIQRRPTSFSWGTEPTCSSEDCAQAITALGNPAFWWIGVIAFLVVLYFAVLWADRRAWAILAGYIGGYVPWFLYLGRTVFTFYTVAFVPFVALALTYFIGVLIGPKTAPPKRRRTGTIIAGSIVVLIIAIGAFFWPIWTAETIPHWYWQAHMWFPSWI